MGYQLSICKGHNDGSIEILHPLNEEITKLLTEKGRSVQAQNYLKKAPKKKSYQVLCYLVSLVYIVFSTKD